MIIGALLATVIFFISCEPRNASISLSYNHGNSGIQEATCKKSILITQGSLTNSIETPEGNVVYSVRIKDIGRTSFSEAMGVQFIIEVKSTREVKTFTTRRMSHGDNFFIVLPNESGYYISDVPQLIVKNWGGNRVDVITECKSNWKIQK